MEHERSHQSLHQSKLGKNTDNDILYSLRNHELVAIWWIGTIGLRTGNGHRFLRDRFLDYLCRQYDDPLYGKSAEVFKPKNLTRSR